MSCHVISHRIMSSPYPILSSSRSPRTPPRCTRRAGMHLGTYLDARVPVRAAMAAGKASARAESEGSGSGRTRERVDTDTTWPGAGAWCNVLTCHCDCDCDCDGGCDGEVEGAGLIGVMSGLVGVGGGQWHVNNASKSSLTRWRRVLSCLVASCRVASIEGHGLSAVCSD